MSEEQQRICSTCKVVKTVDDFSIRTDTNNYRKQCKKCISEKQSNYYTINKDKIVEYQQNNKDKIAAKQAEYRQNNKEQIAVKQVEYRQNNKEKLAVKKAEYYENNKEKIAEYRQNNKDRWNDYERKRRQTDENYRLIKNTRCRIRCALNGKSKSLHTKDILGIDVETYKKWIEFQMTDKMHWSNIQIDHVKPISSFDVSNEDQLLEAFNWKNTQPLLKEDNLRKGCKYNELDYRLQFIKAYEFINSNKINLINESTLSNQSNRN